VVRLASYAPWRCQDRTPPPGSIRSRPRGRGLMLRLVGSSAKRSLVVLLIACTFGGCPLRRDPEPRSPPWLVGAFLPLRSS
jgi:hypothetical protein